MLHAIVLANLRLGAWELVAHPVRTLLVSQGMIWAVALAIVPAAVIGGTRAAAVDRARDLGTDLVQIGVDPSGGAAPTEGDLSALEEELGAAATVSGLRVAPAKLSWSRASNPSGELVWLLGTNDRVGDTRGKRPVSGRYPQPSSDRVGPGGASPVAGPTEVALEHAFAEWVVGSGRDTDLARLMGSPLWLGTPPAGVDATLTLELSDRPSAGARELVVVGVIEDERAGADPMGTRGDSRFADLVGTLLRAVGIAPVEAPWRATGRGIYLPRAAVPGENLDWMFIRVDPTQVGELAARAEKLLVARGRTPLIYTNAVWPILTAPEMQGYLVLHEVFFALFLVMGLLVLANLLLLSGWQRRREIALRRTEGATRADIFVQFVCEGVLIALLGFGLGVACGVGLAEIRVALDPNVVVDAQLPWSDAIRAGLLLTGGAVIASAYPAWRASRHDPMTLFRSA